MMLRDGPWVVVDPNNSKLGAQPLHAKLIFEHFQAQLSKPK